MKKRTIEENERKKKEVVVKSISLIDFMFNYVYNMKQK